MSQTIFNFKLSLIMKSPQIAPNKHNISTKKPHSFYRHQNNTSSDPEPDTPTKSPNDPNIKVFSPNGVISNTAISKLFPFQGEIKKASLHEVGSILIKSLSTLRKPLKAITPSI
jgi:hypothetical protein